MKRACERHIQTGSESAVKPQYVPPSTLALFHLCNLYPAIESRHTYLFFVIVLKINLSSHLRREDWF